MSDVTKRMGSTCFGDDMVREKNVKLMTKMAIYEKNAGRQEIPMTGYFKGDYVRMKTLKSIVGGTIAFAVILLLGILYKAEYILENIMKLDYKQVGIKILIAYIVWVLLYWIVARVLYARRYESARHNIIEYNQNLKRLQEEIEKVKVKTGIPKGGIVINDDFMDF